MPSSVPEYKVVLANGTTLPIAPSPTTGGIVNPPDTAEMPVRGEGPTGTTKRVPLGTIFGARSGDKGGNANVGVWARSEHGYAWLNSFLTVDQFKLLVPEATELVVRRFEFPLLKALNFVIVGMLGEGVSSTTRPDAQAKSLGEYLRSRLVDLPESLLADAPK